MNNNKRTKTNHLAITTAVLFITVVCVISLRANAYADDAAPPPPGTDYDHWKAGWDTAEQNAYWDAYNGHYQGTDGACYHHSQSYCDGYKAGYNDYVTRNNNRLSDQQNVAENNAGVNIHGNDNRVTINQGIGQTNGNDGSDNNNSGNGY